MGDPAQAWHHTGHHKTTKAPGPHPQPVHRECVDRAAQGEVLSALQLGVQRFGTEEAILC
jgi:hypothetical protein